LKIFNKAEARIRIIYHRLTPWNTLLKLYKLLLSSSVSILCPCVRCQELKNGHRLTLKSPLPTPTGKLFLVSNERYGQKNTFLLRCYGTNFASIKRYDQFCLFTVVYKEAQIHPLLTLFILFSCYSFCSHCLPSSPSLCPLSACSLFSLSTLSLSLLSLCLLSLFFCFFLYILSPLFSTLFPFSALSLFLCFYTL